MVKLTFYFPPLLLEVDTATTRMQIYALLFWFLWVETCSQHISPMMTLEGKITIHLQLHFILGRRGSVDGLEDRFVFYPRQTIGLVKQHAYLTFSSSPYPRGKGKRKEFLLNPALCLQHAAVSLLFPIPHGLEPAKPFLLPDWKRRTSSAKFDSHGLQQARWGWRKECLVGGGGGSGGKRTCLPHQLPAHCTT